MERRFSMAAPMQITTGADLRAEGIFRRADSTEELMGKFISISGDILRRSDLSLQAKVVYSYLDFRSGRNGEAWPGVRRMARDMGENKTTIMRIIGGLVAVGLVEKERRGNGQSCVYRIKKRPGSGTVEGETGSKSVPEVGQGVPKAGRFYSKSVPEPDRKKKKKEKEREESAQSSISFDSEVGAFTGLTDADRDRWADRFPGVDLDGELFKMADWLLGNPKRRPKDYRRFITNWLSRAEPAIREEDDPDSIHYFNPEKEKWLEEHVDKPMKLGKYAKVSTQGGPL